MLLRVRLPFRQFTPEPGIDADLRAAPPGTYGLLQLERRPKATERRAIEDGPVTLVEYLGGTTWLALFGSLDDSTAIPLARWAGLWAVRDKLKPFIVACCLGAPWVVLSWLGTLLDMPPVLLGNDYPAACYDSVQ